jgi:hypothetical protein
MRFEVVQGQNLLKVPASRRRHTHVDEADAQRMVREHTRPRILDPLGQLKQLFRDLPSDAVVAAYEVEQPHPEEHWADVRSLAGDSSELAGTRINRRRFWRGVALGRHHRRAEGALQAEFARCAFGRIRQGRE